MYSISPGSDSRVGGETRIQVPVRMLISGLPGEDLRGKPFDSLHEDISAWSRSAICEARKLPHDVWLAIMATSAVRSPHVLLLDTITRGRY
jgi:hypothetical protein